MPKFNPIDDGDRSSEFAVEDFESDKKHAASVNKIGAPMGVSFKQPPGSKRAKKELLLRDTSLYGSNANSEAMERMADSHRSIAVTFKEQAMRTRSRIRWQLWRWNTPCTKAWVIWMLQEYASPKCNSCRHNLL
jgi:hypothetical protein